LDKELIAALRMQRAMALSTTKKCSPASVTFSRRPSPFRKAGSAGRRSLPLRREQIRPVHVAAAGHVVEKIADRSVEGPEAIRPFPVTPRIRVFYSDRQIEKIGRGSVKKCLFIAYSVASMTTDL
jgi:hypothetical protein